MSGSPEVDYQPDRQLHANWWGFFDRESGVKFYQYAFHTRCLDAGVFGHDTNDARVSLTPSLPQPVKFPGSKCTDIPANSLFSGSISYLLSVLCVLMKILSNASAKIRPDITAPVDWA